MWRPKTVRPRVWRSQADVCAARLSRIGIGQGHAHSLSRVRPGTASEGVTPGNGDLSNRSDRPLRTLRFSAPAALRGIHRRPDEYLFREVYRRLKRVLLQGGKSPTFPSAGRFFARQAQAPLATHTEGPPGGYFKARQKKAVPRTLLARLGGFTQ